MCTLPLQGACRVKRKHSVADSPRKSPHTGQAPESLWLEPLSTGGELGQGSRPLRSSLPASQPLQSRTGRPRSSATTRCKAPGPQPSVGQKCPSQAVLYLENANNPFSQFPGRQVPQKNQRLESNSPLGTRTAGQGPFCAQRLAPWEAMLSLQQGDANLSF